MSNKNGNNLFSQEQSLPPQLEVEVDRREEQAMHQPVVKVIKACRTDEKVLDDEAMVEIDGVLVKVKIRERLKDAKAPVCKECGWRGCSLCGPGTWTVLKFDNSSIRKRKDYKAVWKAVFFALKLNVNDILQTDRKEARKREKGRKLAEQEKAKSGGPVKEKEKANTDAAMDSF